MEVAGLAKCNAPEAQAVPLSSPQALHRALPVTSSSPSRPAPSGSRREKEEKKTLPTAEECRQQMLTMGGSPLLGPLSGSDRPLGIGAPFPAGLRSSKGRGRTCWGDNMKLIGYSRRHNVGA